MKDKSEWFVDMPWAGKVAMVSWGQPSNTPVLMLHGYMDSAATFTLLVDKLPDEYYYVAFDMPGHGRSDPFPMGPLVSTVHMVEVMRRVVEHLNWNKFIFLAHSMGVLIGLYYNVAFPNKLRKVINLDPAPPFATHYLVARPSAWYAFFYNFYYENYTKWNYGSPKHYTYDEAVRLLVRSRNLSEEQAEVVISRSLIPVGDGMYKLSWDPRMKRITTVPILLETLYEIVTARLPPTLNIVASKTAAEQSLKQVARKMQELQNNLPNYFIVYVAGHHDVHITDPDLLTPHIVEFLQRDFHNEQSVRARL